MAGNFSKGLCAAIVLSITIVVLAGGCNHPRSTSESATAASKSAPADSKATTAVSTEIWPAMIGRQITIRGTLLPGKFGWYTLLDNHQEVYFPFSSSSAGKHYDEMNGKLVTATGVLRVFECKKQLIDKEGRPVNKEGRVINWCSNYYYFEAGTGQPHLLPDGK